MVAVGLVVAAGVLPAERPLRSEGETLVVTLQRPQSGEPWLGISVHKPTEAIFSSLRGVPKGVGFVIQSVSPEGPATKAGLKKLDFLLKFDNQLVVNEAQFLVLLHLHKVGDSVNLTFQRSEENHEISATLCERPTSEKGRKEADVMVMAGPPVPGIAQHLIAKLRKEASVKADDGVTVRLVRKGEEFHWQQFNPDGMLIHEGDVKGVEDLRFTEGSNPELSKMLRILIRALEDAEKRAMSGERAARIRRVPPQTGPKVPNPR